MNGMLKFSSESLNSISTYNEHQAAFGGQFCNGMLKFQSSQVDFLAKSGIFDGGAVFCDY